MSAAKRAAVALASVALGVGGLTACDTGPECVDSHVVTNVVPVYNAATKSTTLQTVTTVVCDRYAEESPK